jgi:hypothetical protein
MGDDQALGLAEAAKQDSKEHTMKIYVAEMETRHTNSHGYGETPTEALGALLQRWREDFVPVSGADPDYPEEIREEIGIFEVELGKGYVLATGDDLARPRVANGDHPMFDAAFESFRSSTSPN